MTELVLKEYRLSMFLRMLIKSKYIDDIDVWIEMTNSRNLMSHTYDSLKLSEILKNIKEEFYPEVLKMYNYFESEI